VVMVAPPSSAAHGELPPELVGEVRRLLKEILLASYRADQPRDAATTVVRPGGSNRD
jgi:hypothetical protein